MTQETLFTQEQLAIFDTPDQVTHDSWETFNKSLSDKQMKWSELSLSRELWFQLVQIWENNQEVRFPIGSMANDYWRQFTYNVSFFDLHYGQQLHVLPHLLELTFHMLANDISNRKKLKENNG